ncbi:efflux RND transporter periplasmic adaptor subunit [Hoeflea prorocentri]|uniref:Efflux RND transporter periplasmic adaptor subunit n=1 Tax=Hoeflea prorocentri TaxID=1922333 RepID=A0A9X3UEM5_9HYPH|nr:efflux RND transporter periplasmic adaptor subunit [Hoeflea prorocentri]MCY6379463.1 efflux RND transporter periplasmic adaptor subunit [Hoeflea prorocentri]MDA5397263.1 efflux RND transporter periplasmic adaptor subunit [Hoeflea prorocentri]
MKYVSGLTTILGLLLLTIAATAQEQSASKPNVTVATVAGEQLGNRGSYIGRVQAVSTVNIVARVEGFLEQRNFQEGGTVKKGDLLYVIEKGIYEADVASSKAQLEGAQATLKNATIDLERQRILLSKDDVPQSTYDSALATVGQDQASVDEAQASLDTSNINLGYTEIRSPIDGRISKSNIDVGNLVNSNSGTLTTITSVDPIKVSFYMGEKDLIKDRRAGLIDDDNGSLKVKLTLSDGEPFDTVGSITYVGTTVDENSDTVEIQATFANPKNILIPGQFVNVAIEEAQPQTTLVVPQSAVQLDSKGHFVFLVDGSDKIVRQDVDLGRQYGALWAVASGLKEGEKVVVQGIQRVSPGVTVNPVEIKQ